MTRTKSFNEEWAKRLGPGGSQRNEQDKNEEQARGPEGTTQTRWVENIKREKINPVACQSSKSNHHRHSSHIGEARNVREKLKSFNVTKNCTPQFAGMALKGENFRFCC